MASHKMYLRKNEQKFNIQDNDSCDGVGKVKMTVVMIIMVIVMMVMVIVMMMIVEMMRLIMIR